MYYQINPRNYWRNQDFRVLCSHGPLLELSWSSLRCYISLLSNGGILSAHGSFLFPLNMITSKVGKHVETCWFMEYYHAGKRILRILFLLLKLFANVMGNGSWTLELNILRLFSWTSNFNMYSLKITLTQCLLHILVYL